LFNTSNEITVDDNTISSNTYLFVILKDLLALIFFILAILMGVNSYWIVQIKHDAITQIGNKTNDAIIAFAVIAFVNVSLLLFHFIISLWVKQKSKNKKYLCKTICLYTIQTLIFLVLGAVAIYFRVSIDEIPALGFTNRILLICGYGLTWLIVFVLYICYINVTQAKLNVVENKKEGNK
jgi:hypothetical protein